MVKKYDIAWAGKEVLCDLIIHLEWVREKMDSHMHGMKL